MNESNATSLNPKGYVPPKDWDGLTDGEKIERMRDIIKDLQQWVSRLQEDTHKVRENFSNHAHLEGKIMVPHNQYGGGGLVGSAKSSSKFF